MNEQHYHNGGENPSADVEDSRQLIGKVWFHVVLHGVLQIMAAIGGLAFVVWTLPCAW